MIAVAFVCALVALLAPQGSRVKLVALILPLCVDCLANRITGGRIVQTVSARCGMYYPKAAAVIDALFGQGHCRAQAIHEGMHGDNVWRAWVADWRAA